jgi:hypothetical protein
MKAIELELRNEQWATFYLNTNFILHEREVNERDQMRKKIAVLEDGTHRNGGWELADSYDEVKERLNKLFDLEV